MTETDTEMKRKRVFATIREDVDKWVQKEVEKGKFRNRSHAIEFALLKLMESENENEQKEQA